MGLPWVFDLPVIAPPASDLARTTCQRAERRVAALMLADANPNREILRYLNRLSDLCWLLARYAEQLKG
jgi:cob(I)alamin adenosyltransferase